MLEPQSQLDSAWKHPTAAANSAASKPPAKTAATPTAARAADKLRDDALNHNRRRARNAGQLDDDDDDGDDDDDDDDADDDEDFENDSDLGDDLRIDGAGNVLPPTGGSTLNNTSSMAHILAGYGTDICEQLIAEFIKLELNTKQLSSLTDKDLEMLGIRDERIRTQMISEFGDLPNQESVAPAKFLSEMERCETVKESNALILNNVYKHLNSLKTSLSVVLLRLYIRPTENVLINEHMYASAAVLRTLDEFSRSVVGMEKRLLDMQYGMVRPLQGSAHNKNPNKRRRRFLLALFGSLCSVGGVFALRHFHVLRR